MRVVLIGGAGFIGKNLAVKFSEYEYEVLIYDKSEPSWKKIQENKHIKYKKGNFVEEESYSNILQKDDLIIYLVSTSYANNSNLNIYQDAKENILSGIRFLKACSKKKIEKIIFASSGGAIYGKPNKVPIKESHTTYPISSYGIHKLVMERYLDLFQNLYDIPFLSLRISNPYGIGQIPFRGQGVIATFLASILLERKIQVWGDGNAIRDYLYIDDLTEAFYKAVQYKGNSKIFNIGSNTGHSVKEIISSISNITGKIPNVEYSSNTLEEVGKNILDTSLAKKELNWYSKISLEEGIQRFYSHWSQQEKTFIP